jgi:hypothetical protein
MRFQLGTGGVERGEGEFNTAIQTGFNLFGRGAMDLAIPAPGTSGRLDLSALFAVKCL